MYELRHYLSQDGQDLFARWLWIVCVTNKIEPG